MKTLSLIYGCIIFLLLCTVHAQERPLPVCAADRSWPDSLQMKIPAAAMDFDVKHYRIDLEVSDTSSFIRGNVCILSRAGENPLDSICLELSAFMEVDSVFLDSAAVYGIHHESDFLFVDPPGEIAPGTLFSTRIHYHGKGNEAGARGGLSNRLDDRYNARVTYSLSEPFYARDWFPCKQDLNDKADSVSIFITTSGELMAGSNGMLENVVDLPGGLIRYEWRSRYPIAYYLISVAVADYKRYDFYVRNGAPGDSMLISNFLYDHPMVLPDWKEDIDRTGALIGLYSDLFGAYPFRVEKYGHCMAPVGGGMEHQTMTTLQDFNFTLVAHELAHQWFGNYVTCGSWQDIWINEGFASYSEYIALRRLVSQDEADQWLTYAQDMALGEPEGSVYVPRQDSTDAGRLFDWELSYKKGAALVHMIRHALDEDSVFFRVLRTFLEDHAFGTATGEDFARTLESVSGKEFSDFFDQWYYGKGYPVFNMSWSQQGDTLSLTSSQEGTSGETPFFRMEMDYEIEYENGKRDTVRLLQQAPLEAYHLPVKARVVSIDPDPGNHVLDVSFITKRETGQADFSLYPNPFRDHFQIVFPEDGKEREIRITDPDGKLRWRQTFPGRQMDIRTDFLSNGPYIVTVIEGDDLHSRLIIKQE